MRPAILALLLLPGVAAAQPPAAGHYVYRDREMDAAVDLRPDGSFSYRIDGIGPPVPGEGRLHIRYVGVWRAGDHGDIALTNAPTPPPLFEQVAAERDASVLAAITVKRTDGAPVYGVDVDAGEIGGGFANTITGGPWVLPLDAAAAGRDTMDGPQPTPRLDAITVSREGDGLVLATVRVRPGGPNRFTFRYRPSPVEPFHLAARIGDGGRLEVEAGQAGLPMQRTGPAQAAER